MSFGLNGVRGGCRSLRELGGMKGIGRDRVGVRIKFFEGPLSADSVEKVAPFAGLRQNIFIGRRGITQHDGTVIEWTGTIVLLVQP